MRRKMGKKEQVTIKPATVALGCLEFREWIEGKNECITKDKMLQNKAYFKTLSNKD